MSFTANDGDVLKDVFDASSEIMEFISGMDEVSFDQDRRTQRAVLHALTIIGEAVKRLSREFRDGHASVDWSAIAGTRDILVHHYQKVDLSEVWRMASSDIPKLNQYIQPLIPPEEDA